MEFITRRLKKHTSTSPSSDIATPEKGDSSMDSCNSTIRSIDTTTNCAELIELKLQIEQFTMELDGAQMEIESLTTENKQLKNELTECRNIINNLAQKEISVESSPKVASNKKSGKKTKIIKKTKEIINNGTSNDTVNSHNIANDENKQTKETKIQASPPKKKQKNNSQQTQMNKVLTQTSTAAREHNKIQLSEESSIRIEKRKICLVSSDNKNKILSNAINILENDIILHYCYPGVGIETLFKNLTGKLKNYSLNDYCILFIGQSDFDSTENYHSMVEYIRNQLKLITNTNIIICAPTFRYGHNVNLFNHRVEIFNNLLYLDVMTHEHAYLLDSNKNLSYSIAMFNKLSGKINMNGIRKILYDMKALIQDVDEYWGEESTSQQFFREF